MLTEPPWIIWMNVWHEFQRHNQWWPRLVTHICFTRPVWVKITSELCSLQLFNRLFRRRSKKTSELRVTGLCKGTSPVTGEFPAQRASNADKVLIWRRDVIMLFFTSFSSWLMQIKILQNYEIMKVRRIMIWSIIIVSSIPKTVINWGRWSLGRMNDSILYFITYVITHPCGD